MPRGRGGLFTNLMFSSKSDSPGLGKPKSLGQARTILWTKLHFSGAERDEAQLRGNWHSQLGNEGKGGLARLCLFYIFWARWVWWAFGVCSIFSEEVIPGEGGWIRRVAVGILGSETSIRGGAGAIREGARAYASKIGVT